MISTPFKTIFVSTLCMTCVFAAQNNFKKLDLDWADKEYMLTAEKHPGQSFVFSPLRASELKFNFIRPEELNFWRLSGFWPKCGEQYVLPDGERAKLYLIDDSNPNHLVRAYENFTLDVTGEFGCFDEHWKITKFGEDFRTPAPPNGFTVISVRLKSSNCIFVAITSAKGMGISSLEKSLGSTRIKAAIENLRPRKCRLNVMPILKVSTGNLVFELGPCGIGPGHSLRQGQILPLPSYNFGGGSTYLVPKSIDFFYSFGGERSRDFVFFVYDIDSGKTLMAGRFLGGKDVIKK